jgi:hypothetical protein
MNANPFLPLLSALLLAPLAMAAAPKDAPPGVISHIQVLSDKVPDVSSLEAWQRSFLRPGMTDREKALAAWRRQPHDTYAFRCSAKPLMKAIVLELAE